MTQHGSDALRGPLPDAVVHELRTAMSMVLGFAELLETRDDPETRSEAARGIVLAAARLRSTIETVTGTSLDNGSSPQRVLTDAEPRPKHRLMVIDDDAAEVEVLRAAFPKESYEMVDVRNPDEGFDVLDELDPDLVILDWKLPGGGGAETLAELKLRNPDLPVIVLDDEGDPKQRRIAALLDANEFLTRPFNAVELLSRAEDLAD